MTKVYVLYTGGTFGMKPNPKLAGSPLTAVALHELRPKLPQPADLPDCADIEVTFEELPGERRIDSSSMTPDDWIAIAHRIRDRYDQYDGFVVIQGTDTLSYTASALSFMFENLIKPIVVTGSQQPFLATRTDACLNYCHSLMIAGYKSTGLPCIPEVIVVFADKVMRGCRVRKMSASAWAGFDTPNAPLLGQIGDHIRIFEGQIRPPPLPDSNLRLHTSLETDVLDFSLYPGMQPDHLRQILSLKKVRGVILRTFGNGNAPEAQEFIEALRNGIEKNDKHIVNITQCPQGEVEMGVYAASVVLMDLGILSGSDMTPEAALTKLMVLMGSSSSETVRREMQIDQRGEQSHSLFNLENTNPAHKNTLIKGRTFDARHPHFKPHMLESAMLRIYGLVLDERSRDKPVTLGVYLNLPQAQVKGRSQITNPDPSKLICKFVLDPAQKRSKPFDIAQPLPIKEIKKHIRDHENSISVVFDTGFYFRKVVLTLNTKSDRAGN
jgi:L-asparaginase